MNKPLIYSKKIQKRDSENRNVMKYIQKVQKKVKKNKKMSLLCRYI